jgi:hypothetical protein
VTIKEIAAASAGAKGTIPGMDTFDGAAADKVTAAIIPFAKT